MIRACSDQYILSRNTISVEAGDGKKCEAMLLGEQESHFSNTTHLAKFSMISVRQLRICLSKSKESTVLGAPK